MPAFGNITLVCPYDECGVEHVVQFKVESRGTDMKDWGLHLSYDSADVYAHAWHHEMAAVQDE